VNANATGCANGSITNTHSNAGSLYSSLGSISAGTVVGDIFAAGTASDASGTGSQHPNQTNLPVFSLPPVPNPAAANSGGLRNRLRGG